MILIYYCKAKKTKPNLPIYPFPKGQLKSIIFRNSDGEFFSLNGCYAANGGNYQSGAELENQWR